MTFRWSVKQASMQHNLNMYYALQSFTINLFIVAMLNLLLGDADFRHSELQLHSIDFLRLDLSLFFIIATKSIYLYTVTE